MKSTFTKCPLVARKWRVVRKYAWSALNQAYIAIELQLLIPPIDWVSTMTYEQTCAICGLLHPTPKHYWQIWVRVNASDGRVLEDLSCSWISRCNVFPYFLRAREYMFCDDDNVTALWAYICPADAQSVHWNGKHLDWSTHCDPTGWTGRFLTRFVL